MYNNTERHQQGLTTTTPLELLMKFLIQNYTVKFKLQSKTSHEIYTFTELIRTFITISNYSNLAMTSSKIQNTGYRNNFFMVSSQYVDIPQDIKVMATQSLEYV